MKTRITAASLAICILFSLFIYSPVNVSADAAVSDDSYAFAIEFLNQLGIADGVDTVGETMSRGQFARFVSNVLKHNLTIESDVKYFDDVDLSCEFAQDISLLAATGLISGSGTGSFLPDNPITYNEALVIFVNLLGYRAQAAINGDYPLGYAKVANELKLLSGISIANLSGAAQGKALAVLMYKALGTDVQTSYVHGDEIKYEIRSGRTLLYDKLGLMLYKGRLNSVGEAGFMPGAPLSKKLMTVGEKLFDFNLEKTEDYQHYLGFTVWVYYENDEDKEPFIKYLIPKIEADDFLSLEAEQIVSFSGQSLVYHANDSMRESVAVIAQAPYVLYNNRRVLSLSEDMLKIDLGSVTLITDGDLDYQIVIIWSYDNYVVHRFDNYSKVLYDKYMYKAGNPLPPLDESRNIVVSNANGAKWDLNALREWNIVSIARAKDDSYIKLVISVDSMEEEVEEIFFGSADEAYITVDGMELKLAKSFLNKFSYTDSEGEERLSLNVGNRGKFYLDFEGNVAAFDENANIQRIKQAGVLIDCKILSGIDKTHRMLIFTKFGEMTEFDVGNNRKNLLVNGQNRNVGEFFEELSGADGGLKRQVLVYTLNSEGIITEIEYADGAESRLRRSYQGSQMYRAQLRSFNGQAVISDATVIFSIPPEEYKDYHDYYKLSKLSMFSSGVLYNVDAYIYDENKLTCDYLIETSDPAFIGVETQIAMVKKITESVNMDGDSVDKLYCLANGVLTELLGAQGVSLKNTKLNPSVVASPGTSNTIYQIAPGDTIRYSLNQKGEISAIQLLYSCENQGWLPSVNPLGSSSGQFGDTFRTVCGYVLRREGNVIEIALDNSTTIELYATERFKFHVYDGERIQENRVYIGTADDIRDKVHYPNNYSKIVISIRVSEARIINLYN